MFKKEYIDKITEITVLFTVFFMGLVFCRSAADPFWVTEEFFIKFSASALLIVYLCGFLVEGKITYVKTPFNYLLAAFIAANLLGVFKMTDIYSFMDKVYLNLSYIILFFAVSFYVSARPQENTKRIFAALLSSGALMGLYGILQSAGMDIISWRADFSGRAASTLGNPNFLAGHMLVLIPVSYGLFLASRGKLPKAAAGLTALILTVALLLTQTRGAYLGYIIAAFFFFAAASVFSRELISRHKKLLLVFFAALVAVTGVYLANNNNLMRRIKDIVAMKDEAAHIRVSLWKNSLYMIKDNPVLGSGAGNYHIKYSYYQAAGLTPADYERSSYYKSGHAHNDILQYWAEYGIAGLGAMAAVFFVFFRMAASVMKRRDEKSILAAGVSAGVLGIIIHGLFNFPLLIVPTASVFYIFLAIMAYYSGKTEIKETAAGAGLKAAIIVLILAAVSGASIAAQALLSNSYLRKAKESDFFGSHEAAVKYAMDAVRVNPLNEENYYFSGQMLDKTGDSERAYFAYKKACSLNPGFWEANAQLFSASLKRGEREEPLKIARNMYKISPYSLKAITALGYAYYLNRLFNEAIELYEKSLVFKKDSPDILYHLSASYGAANKPDKAIEYGNRVLRVAPGHAGAYYNIGVAYIKKNDMKGAKRILARMKTLFPGDKETLNLDAVIKSVK